MAAERERDPGHGAVSYEGPGRCVSLDFHVMVVMDSVLRLWCLKRSDQRGQGDGDAPSGGVGLRCVVAFVEFS